MQQSSFRRPLEAWRGLSPYLGASTRRVGGVALANIARGAFEAGVLVMIARIGLALTDGSDVLRLEVGPLGQVEVSVRTAIIVATSFAAAMLGLHLASVALVARMQGDAFSTARTRLSTAFLGAEWDLQAKEREGQLQEVMTTYVQRVATASVQITSLLAAACNLATLTLAAFLVDSVAALTLLVAVVLLVVVLRPLNILTRKRAQANLIANTEYATSVTEMAGVANEIATFDVGEAVGERLRQSALRASRTQERVIRITRSVPGVYQSLAMMLLLAGLAVIDALGTGRIASLGAVVLLLFRAMAYGQQVQSGTNVLSETVPFLRRVRAQEQLYLNAQRVAGSRALDSIESLELDGAHYDYGDGSDVLVDVSVAIQRGEVIGVVGPSGGGKSTLIQLLLRLRTPTRGAYRINGIPAPEFALGDWYRFLGVVPQTSRLFEGTAADNIRFYRDEISDHDVIDAARRAHLHDEIMGWPDGYDTVLRGLGSGVSGGQAQRLCLARALVGDPQLLVLDEPTSALDSRSETLIQDALNELKGEMTMIIIAHRLSTLRRCDRILVLEKGRVRGFDTPDALQRDNSYYREALQLAGLA